MFFKSSALFDHSSDTVVVSCFLLLDFVKPVGVSIASSRESRPKAHKTAMVAPFMRREVNEEEKEKKLSNQEKDLTKVKLKFKFYFAIKLTSF